MNFKLISLILVVMAAPAYSQQSSSTYRNATCLTDPNLQDARSEELKKLLEADQNDRENWEKLSKQQLDDVAERDLERRIRVGEIFAEGCFKTAGDYAEAALIYQHGDVPDHYFQSFIWSYRGVTLGDEQQKNMMALAIDRYLVSIGKKQLFGSQGFASDATGWCICMQPAEVTFPESMRQQYLGKSLNDIYAEMSSLNDGKENCTIDCPQPLEPSPQGSVPGFW